MHLHLEVVPHKIEVVDLPLRLDVIDFDALLFSRKLTERQPFEDVVAFALRLDGLVHGVFQKTGHLEAHHEFEIRRSNKSEI